MAAYPIEEILPALRAALRSESRRLILQAPPGAGKTTLVPLALLDEPWLAGKSILMLEPRRLAARAAAARMAALRHETPGETVGYRIRFDSKVSRHTRIEVLTEGILTRRLQRDPSLEGVGLVIFDEFHERHLHADLALALCRDVQATLREELRILIMSATLDGEGLSRQLDNAVILTSRGQSFPVAVQMTPPDAKLPLPQAISQSVQRAVAAHAGDVLVFLPGAWEIRRCAELLEAALPSSEFTVLPLYGDLPWEAQDRALRPLPDKRKIVLATPIAETSLTIEGVRIVIDSGLARVPQFDPNSGLTRLITQRIARANADQRTGRAGRTAPGVCYRLWNDNVQRGLLAQPIAEIQLADLAPMLLELSAWGVTDPSALRWIDPPPNGAMAQAREVLQSLDALQDDGRISTMGRPMVELPVHPRLAHMMLRAEGAVQRGLACDIAALLSERDILSGTRSSVDVSLRLEALFVFRRHGRDAARRYGADGQALTRVDQTAQQFRRLLQVTHVTDESQLASTGALLAAAYPDRVAQQRDSGDGRYVLANGRGVRLPKHETQLRSAYLVVASLDAGDSEGQIQLAASLTLDELRAQCASQIVERDDVRWDMQQQAVLARREAQLGAIVLNRNVLPQPNVEALRQAMLEGIRRLGMEVLPWTPALRQWQARVLCLRQWCPDEGWPDVSDTALLHSLEDWLAGYLDGVTRREHLSRIDLSAALQSRLDWSMTQRLNQGAPPSLTVPSGSTIALQYQAGSSPVLPVKLQELFGLADTPRVAWGRIPVTLHLLSPARRPIQVTQDLKNFWQHTYTEVKKELKGRYPKHPWPDDPWNAPPTARAKPRVHK